MPTTAERIKEWTGLAPSTAKSRLDKDIMFTLATQAGHTCFQCGGNLTRETFSIEHKTPWLSADDPGFSFFDLNNIAFSHNLCNSTAAARKQPKIYDSPEDRKRAAHKRYYEKYKEKIKARHKANRLRRKTITVEEVLNKDTGER